MIDPLLSLAFAIHHNKGVYAVLFGSGLSRSAGIWTSWDIVKDLIRKLAQAQDEDCELNPEVWYKAKYGEDAGYSQLLEGLSKSPAERSQILRGYIEPTDDERAQGLKQPTKAHRAIAEMVRSGHIRVIVTTNFDRLMERALEDLGIVPSVISNNDDIIGAKPMQHTVCTIIKVHGDYIEPNTKNIVSELDHYDPKMDALLDRVFDEYGLIICGWSGDWDPALRHALERSPRRRFTTYWTSTSKPSETAYKIIENRQAEEIRIENADSFFKELGEKIMSLEQLDRQHPLTRDVAVATLKRYLLKAEYQLDLEDLVYKETELLRAQLTDDSFPVSDSIEGFTNPNLEKRVRRYESFVEVVQGLMAAGCYWGSDQQASVWSRMLRRIAMLETSSFGLEVWISLKSYPALLLLYTGGIAALANNDYKTFATLLAQTEIKDHEARPPEPAIMQLNVEKVLPRSVYREVLPGRREGEHTPFSNYLSSVLREPLKRFLPDQADYDACFDRFEYLAALVNMDVRERARWGFTSFVGSFWWRMMYRPEKERANRQLANEMADLGDDHPLLKAGLFEGSLQRLHTVKTTYDKELLTP